MIALDFYGKSLIVENDNVSCYKSKALLENAWVFES
jgi:hypothetical protein